jgi:hypothetical protein
MDEGHWWLRIDSATDGEDAFVVNFSTSRPSVTRIMARVDREK